MSQKAIANLELQDVEIEMKAFELDPSASRSVQGPTVDRFARKYGLTMDQAQDRVDGISRMGKEAGLDFRYAETQYTNTFDAHRLTKLTQAKNDPELTDRLIERLYKAYFTEGISEFHVMKNVHMVTQVLPLGEEKEAAICKEVLDEAKQRNDNRIDSFVEAFINYQSPFLNSDENVNA